MPFNTAHVTRRAVLFSALAVTTGLTVAQESSVVVGKDNWLFTRYEYATPSDAQDTQTSIELLTQASKLFAQKGIAVAFVLVPSKVRIYSDKLPDDKPLDAYTNGKYAAAVQALTAAGVHVVNLNDVFLTSPDRLGDTPLFLRLDTHWSPKGAYVAAETVGKSLASNPVLSPVLNAIPQQKYAIAWSPNKVATRARDLVRLLPKGAPNYPPEQVLPYKVTQEGQQAGLVGAGEDIRILAIGSSYSSKNTGYPDALRYVLQRNLLDISLPVDFGPWYGILSYLKDDAYKTNPPKLILWEIPERELRSPPNYKFRNTEYIMDNAAWLAELTRLLK